VRTGSHRNAATKAFSAHQPKFGETKDIISNTGGKMMRLRTGPNSSFANDNMAHFLRPKPPYDHFFCSPEREPLFPALPEVARTINWGCRTIR